MFKKIVILAASLALAACGQMVEVPPSHVGKIITKDGYKEGTIATSKFRLDPCLNYCDDLVVVNVSDFSAMERMETFMPVDKLTMTFDVRMTMFVRPDQQEWLFNKIPPNDVDDRNRGIDVNRAVAMYIPQIVRTISREVVTEYSIGQVSSNLDVINAKLLERLSVEIEKKTPFGLRTAGIGELKYPQIITEAQENAARRREKIAEEEANLTVSQKTLERELQEAQLRRKVEVEKANADAQVAAIMAKSVTPEWLAYRKLEVAEKLAASQNTKIIPMEMVNDISTKVAVGNMVGSK